MQFLEEEITGYWYYNERGEDADSPYTSFGCTINSDATGHVAYLEAMVFDEGLNSVIMGMYYQNAVVLSFCNRK